MENFKETAEKIRSSAKDFKIFAGFDGYVDDIIHVVKERYGTGVNDYHRYEKIADYGIAVQKAAGLSANFEMMNIDQKLGGNGPIYANAMLKLGVDVTYCGKIGHPDIHPVFRPMSDHPRCKAISRWNPAHTDALEFLDGKLIIGKMRSVYEITFDSVKDALGGAENMAALIGESDLIAALNWTMLPFMDGILTGIAEEILPSIKFGPNKTRPYFYFDIADPAKRTDSDIQKFLIIMKKLNKDFRVVLGLNEREAHRVAGILGISDPQNLDYEVLSREMFGKLGIHCLAIHPVKCAFAVTEEGYAHVDGPYCEKPVLTTGAGDNFNAGFCLGLLCGLSTQDALKAGVCMSGFYVRNGRSAELAELLEYMEGPQ